jgi:hypothetical protein
MISRRGRIARRALALVSEQTMKEGCRYQCGHGIGRRNGGPECLVTVFHHYIQSDSADDDDHAKADGQ